MPDRLTAFRRIRTFLSVAAAAALAPPLSACTTVVVPPTAVEDPVRVALLDHGHHASLLVTVDDGTMVQYAYGDWRWFAGNRTGVLEGSAAVVWPTRAALGRMRLKGPLSAAAIAAEVRAPVEHTLILVVEADAVRRLVARLERIVHDGPPLVENAIHNLMFAPHPEPYWILHNSNHVTAEWLEELGCGIEGPAILSVWRLKEDR